MEVNNVVSDELAKLSGLEPVSSASCICPKLLPFLSCALYLLPLPVAFPVLCSLPLCCTMAAHPSR